MVLDGAVNLDDASSVGQIQGFERALGHFATWCAAQRCGLGDDRAAVLDARPEAPHRPRRPPAARRAGPAAHPAARPVGRAHPALRRHGRLAAPRRGARQAPGGGRGPALLALADRGNERGRDGRYGSIATAFPAIRCLDSQATSVADADRRAAASVPAPVLGPSAGPTSSARSGRGPRPEAGHLHRSGDRPVVVVGTTGDPATPYEYAVDMARDLDSAVLVTHEGEGHTAYGSSACVRRPCRPT